MTKKGKILGPHTAAQLGLSETGADIEDNVQYVLAKKEKCRIVITNNYKDYRALQGIQVFRPTEVRRLPR